MSNQEVVYGEQSNLVITPEAIGSAAVLLGTLAKGVFRAASLAGNNIPWDKAVQIAAKQAGELLVKATQSVADETVKVVLKMENNTESSLKVLPGFSYCSSGGMKISADDLAADEFDYYCASKNTGTAGACGWTIYLLEPDGIEVLVGWMHSYWSNKNPPFVACDIGPRGQFSGMTKKELQKKYIGIAPSRHPDSPDGEVWGYTGASQSYTPPKSDTRYEIRAFFSKEESRYELEKYVKMRDLVKRTLEEAKSEIALANLVVGEIEEADPTDQIPAGCVIKQYPAAGDEIPDGSYVNLMVARKKENGVRLRK